MNTKKQVRPVFPGDLQPFAEGHVIVSTPGQEGAVALFLIQNIPQLFADFENHILFPGTRPSNGTRIFTAVAGINDNDPIFSLCFNLFPFPGFPQFDLGQFYIHHHAIRLFLKFFQLEHTGIDMIGQQDLHPDDLLGKAQHRDAFNPRFVQNGLGRNRLRKGRLFKINQDFFLAFFDDKVRFIAGVNHHSRMIRGNPVPYIQDIDQGISIRCQKTYKKQYRQ